MRNTGFLLLSACLVLSIAASAQDVHEAYNLSDLSVQGTARSMGFGNALGSVGGDFSSVSVNPAGLGIYRSSELSLTPSLKINGTSSEYTGATMSDNSTRFNFNNFGIVLTNAPKGKRYDHRNWKTVSFALGMNRVADFNYNYTYTGKTNSSSASQVFESDANLNPGNATTINNSYGSMGYQSYLLNQNAAGQFATIVPFTGGVNQLKSNQITGGINEYTMSLGGNYKEKLMLGITIGIPVVNYQSNYYFQESLAEGNTSPNPSGFQSFNYNDNVNVNGAGVNAKLGAIYKFSDIFRIGAAFHTPTYYSINDLSSPGITTSRYNGDSVATLGGWGLQNEFNYHFTTPWKGVLSATIMLNTFGFITADYEYVDYSTMRYMYPGGIDFNTNLPFQEEADQINQEIKKTYKGASNFRLGAEGRITNTFMVRAGFGYYGNAYTPYGQSTANQYYTTQRIDLSLGAGLHFRRFFSDVAIVHSMYTGYEQPYTIDYSGVVSSTTPATIPTAKINYGINNVALTVGMKFDTRSGDSRRYHHHHYNS